MNTKTIQPASAGFSLLAKQGFPFSRVPAFVSENPVDKKRFPLVHENIERAISRPLPVPEYTVLKAWSEAERNRLVESSKCPTPEISSIQAQARAIDKRLESWGIRPKKPKSAKTPEQWAADEWIEAKTRELYADQPERLGVELEKLEKQRRSVFPVVKQDEDLSRGDSEAVSAWAVVSQRKWSGQYRIRTQVDQPSGLPPEQSGLRVTKTLSEGGARKIADSCNFMNVQNGGYKTFMTLTLDTAGRRRVEDLKASGLFTEINTEKRGKRGALSLGMIKPKSEKLTGLKVGDVWVKTRDDVFNWLADADFSPVERIGGKYYAAATGEEFDDVAYSTIQKELGRFFDAANKMRQRGWKATRLDKFKKPVMIRGKAAQVVAKPSRVVAVEGFLADKRIKVRRKGVSYSWVVENPLNEHGKRNPHIHILIDWRVSYTQFFAWADRLEKLWGQGVANMEKILDSGCAGAYLAKAAGYMTKANGESDQGPVRGNRYGISKDARAPGWACIGRYPIHIMGHLIKDVSDYFQHSYGALAENRRKLSVRAAEIRKEIKAESDVEKLNLLRGRQKSIGQRLAAARDTLAGVPAIPSKYQLIINTEQAMDEFLAWAMSPDKVEASAWLPEKSEDEQWRPWEERPKGLWLKTYQMVLHAKKAARRWDGIAKVYKQWTEFEPVSRAVCQINEWLEFKKMGWAA